MRSEERRNQEAMLALIMYQPVAAALLHQPSRLEQMAQELAHALRHTSKRDLAELFSELASDGSSALGRRISGLWNLLEKVVVGLASETGRASKAYLEKRLSEHLGVRAGMAAVAVANALSNGAKSLSALARDLRTNPSDVVPKLMVLVLSSVAASGGVDGNGGLPDSDIPLIGIGAHRSPFTHSIIIGSALEAAILLITRIVLCTHKNLPASHDPLWDGIARRSVDILSSAGKGASIGIAYHLMVDAVVQPGAYHGLPFHMPIEAHQAIIGANSIAEAKATLTYPDSETITDVTPEILAAHKKFRAVRMELPEPIKQWLTTEEIAILNKYGAWLQALAQGKIPPTTIEQVRFVKVVARNIVPVSSHELAWKALADAKVLSDWLTPSSQQ